jgi:hypothetical protein
MESTRQSTGAVVLLRDPVASRRIYLWFWTFIGLGVVFFVLIYPLGIMWDDMGLSGNRVSAIVVTIFVWPDLVANGLGCFVPGPETAPHFHGVGLLLTQLFGWGSIGLGIGFRMAVCPFERNPSSQPPTD